MIEETKSRSNLYQEKNHYNVMPIDRLEKVPSWGGASKVMSYVYRPSTLDELRRVYQIARSNGRNIGLRGAGNSYGDASLNEENIVLDMRRMNRILEWDPDLGRIRVEPGVTISQLWQYVLEDGWWPAVVPGTSKPTIGGCTSMNIHGKNAWKAGTFGDHVYEFDLLLPSGDIVSCSRDQNSDLFHAAIGGVGMLGTFTSVTLGLRPLYSGLIRVEAYASGNLKEMMDQFTEHLSSADYLVGWIDAFAKGKSLGRGQIHKANYLPPAADPFLRQSLRTENQHLPENILGLFPRSIVWRLMRPLMNDFGSRFTNFGKYWFSRVKDGSSFLEPHVAFHFLLDYVPNWKLGFGPGGLIQYQSFIPTPNALDAFSEILRLCQRRGLINYLTVLKKHRRDDFLLSHGVEGYSMAMDFRITPGSRPMILKLAHELDAIVLDAGGRFYFAKDSTLRPEVMNAYLGEDTVRTFRSLKDRYDPDGLLQTNLWRRLFSV